MRDRADSAGGYVLAAATLGFGVVGWIAGMMGGHDSGVWFLCAAILGILAIATVLDESRLRPTATSRMLEASLSWLLSAWAFGMGVVGFVAGLMLGSGHSREWLFGGIIIALVAVAMMADEGRRLRAGTHGTTDEIFGGLSSLLAIGVGIVGFILGIMGNGFANEWLFAGVIAGLAAVAFMFDGERRAAVAAARVPVEGPEAGEQFRNRFVS